MNDYPEGLPYPLREGYGMESVSPLISSPLQSGRFETRRNFKNTPVPVDLIWELDAGQAQLFEAWWEYTLISGSLPFDCPLLTPLGLDKYTAKFREMYKGGYLAKLNHWRFTARVWLLKRPLIDKDWLLYAPEYVLYSNIFDRTMNREWPEAL